VSFGNRMREQQQTSSRGMSAIISALVLLGGTVAPSAPVVETQTSQQVAPTLSTKEFADTSIGRRKRQQAPKQNRIDDGDGKHAAKWDSRKARRRLLMAVARRPDTSRQWELVRRQLRHSSHAYLLNTPAWLLAEAIERAKQAGRLRTA
jgi:hypothetical protein